MGPRAAGGGQSAGSARRSPGPLTWVLVTGHLLVLGVQRPRRPGLFPQLHVWALSEGREGEGSQDAGAHRGPLLHPPPPSWTATRQTWVVLSRSWGPQPPSQDGCPEWAGGGGAWGHVAPRKLVALGRTTPRPLGPRQR